MQQHQMMSATHLFVVHLAIQTLCECSLCLEVCVLPLTLNVRPYPLLLTQFLFHNPHSGKALCHFYGSYK